MKLPKGARFWYELSIHAFTRDFVDLPKDMVVRLIDSVAGTSGGVEPGPNLKRGIGILAEDMQKVPVQVDLRDPASARKALGPQAIQTLKYGSFSNTMQFTGGLSNKAPLSTNDVQVASMFGVDQTSFRKTPVLYEVTSRFFMKLRDLQNQQLDKTGQPYQPWETWQGKRRAGCMSASGRTRRRRRSTTTTPLCFRRSSPISARRGRACAQRQDHAGEALKDPRTPNVMSSTRARFQATPLATIESASVLTPEGLRASEAMARVKDQPWAGKFAKDYEAIQRRAFKAVGRRRKKDKMPSIISELFSAVTGRDVDVSRIDPDGYGTFEGAVSPNMRIPMTGAAGDDSVTRRVSAADLPCCGRQGVESTGDGCFALRPHDK